MWNSHFTPNICETAIVIFTQTIYNRTQFTRVYFSFGSTINTLYLMTFLKTRYFHFLTTRRTAGIWLRRWHPCGHISNSWPTRGTRSWWWPQLQKCAFLCVNLLNKKNERTCRSGKLDGHQGTQITIGVYVGVVKARESLLWQVLDPADVLLVVRQLAVTRQPHCVQLKI